MANVLNFKEILKGYGKKLAIVILILSLLFFLYHLERSFLPHFTSNFVEVENLSNFIPENYSIVIDSVLEGDFCDVYLSGPSRELIYLGGWYCDELIKTGLRMPDIISKFDYNPGDYTLFVVSDANETYELEFTVLP